MAEWREEGKAEIVPGVRQTDRQGYLTAKPWSDSDKRFLLKKKPIRPEEINDLFLGPPHQ